MGTIKTTNIETITGSGTLTLGQSGETISIPTNTTLGASGTTITVPSGCTITNNGTQTGFGGTNTPAFQARMSADQSFSSGATFKVDFDTEVFDTDSAYDPTTNQRFTVPSGQAGKYYIHGKIFFNDIASTDAAQIIRMYKNGSQVAAGVRRTVGTTGRDATVSVSQILDLSVADYIEIYAYTNAGSGSLGSANGYNIFEGYKIIE